MKWVEDKKLPADYLEGVEIECHEVEGQVRAIEFRQGDKLLRVERGESYSDRMRVLVPKPLERDERWLLSGEFRGIKINEYHEHREDANSRHRALDNDAALTVRKVTAEIDDDGNVVGVVAPATCADDEIPF